MYKYILHDERSAIHFSLNGIDTTDTLNSMTSNDSMYNVYYQIATNTVHEM